MGDVCGFGKPAGRGRGGGHMVKETADTTPQLSLQRRLRGGVQAQQRAGGQAGACWAAQTPGEAGEDGEEQLWSLSPSTTCVRDPPTFKKPVCRGQGASAVCGTPRPGHGSDTLAGSADVSAACRAPLPVVPDDGLRGGLGPPPLCIPA